MPNKKKQTTRKKSAKKATPKQKVARKKTISMRSLARKTKFSAKRRRLTSTGLVVETVPPVPVRPDVLAVPRRGAGDLQGLSNRPTANSESVEELVEEGNALEVEAVQGVENALDADQGEVRTKEVPEDDAPQEYLDKNQ